MHAIQQPVASAATTSKPYHINAVQIIDNDFQLLSHVSRLSSSNLSPDQEVTHVTVPTMMGPTGHSLSNVSVKQPYVYIGTSTFSSGACTFFFTRQLEKQVGVWKPGGNLHLEVEYTARYIPVAHVTPANAPIRIRNPLSPNS